MFLDGLVGHPLTTLRGGDDAPSSWPHWLAEEFGPRIRVWSLGYATSPTLWQRLGIPFQGRKDPEAAVAMSLVRRAENDLDRLVLEKIGERPVCFTNVHFSKGDTRE